MAPAMRSSARSNLASSNAALRAISSPTPLAPSSHGLCRGDILLPSTLLETLTRTHGRHTQEMKDAPPEVKAREEEYDSEYRDTAAPNYQFHNPYPKPAKAATESSKPSAGPTDDFELPAGIQRQYVGACASYQPNARVPCAVVVVV